MSVLFVQQRTHRAGAQTCLARLLHHADMRTWRPQLVCAQPGWLTEECERHAVPCLVEPFPSSRMLVARLCFNAAFARRVRARLTLGPVQLVQANDHLEGLLARALARALGARSVMLLRSSGMSRQDYFKYHCHRFDLVAAVGEELQSRAQSWDPARTIQLLHDGLYPSELAEVHPGSASFPRRLLILGSPSEAKGWDDMMDALAELETDPTWPALQLDFTGPKPAPQANAKRSRQLQRTHCHFLGRVEKFPELARQYGLVINPSRRESFGMAALEVAALGVPLISSRTGVIEQVITQPEFLFQAHQPADLARVLRNLHRNWATLPFDSLGAQRRIRQQFLIDQTVQKLTTAYAQLLPRQ